jgi:hypothetical protein
MHSEHNARQQVLADHEMLDRKMAEKCDMDSKTAEIEQLNSEHMFKLIAVEQRALDAESRYIVSKTKNEEWIKNAQKNVKNARGKYNEG